MTLNLNTITVEEIIKFLANLMATLQTGEAIALREQLGIDIDKDPEDDVRFTSGQQVISNPVGVALATLMLQVLDQLDSTPGDGLVEFREKFRYKIWGIISTSGESRFRLLAEKPKNV